MRINAPFRHPGSGNSSPKSVLRAIQATTMTHTITRASQKVVYSSTPSAASLTIHTSAVAPAVGMPLETNQFDARRSQRA